MKLSQEDFDTLQDGLDALLEQEKCDDIEANDELVERIKNAEEALIAIGIE